MASAFRAVVALTSSITCGRVAVTEDDLHRFFVTKKFKDAALATETLPLPPKHSAREYVADMLNRSGLVKGTVVTAAMLEEWMPTRSEKGLNGYVLTPEGRAAMGVSGWS